MEIFQNLSIELVSFVVFGVVIFVTGTTKLREHLRFKKCGTICEATVLQSNHVSQNDKQGNLIQSYYELRVGYKENGHKKQANIKSLQEYGQDTPLTIVINKGGKEDVGVCEGPGQPMYTAWILIAAGILTTLLPVIKNDYGMTGSFLVLSILFLLLSLYFMLSYLSDKKRKIIPVEAEITDLLHWKKGKEGAKLIKPVISYYPILMYEHNGAKYHIRSKYNYTSESACRVGNKKMIYYDEEYKCAVEQCGRRYMLIWSIVFFLIAVSGLVSL